MLFYMVCISSQVTPAAPLRSCMREEKLPVPVTELTLYFSKYAKFRSQPQPEARPQLPE